MTAEEKARVLSQFDPWDTMSHAPARAAVNGADLSLNERDEIARSLGAVFCACSPEKNGHVSMVLGPAGCCDLCGTKGAFYDEAVAYWGAKKNGTPEIFKAVPLAPLMKAGVPDPVLLCRSLLYQGGLHSIAGPPDCGKTTIALWWIVELLRQGKRILFLDEEGGQEIVTERLIALGVTLDELERLTYVPYPARRWTDADIAALLELASTSAMVLVDSSAAFLAQAGWDENLAGDVTRFWSRVLTPLARQGNAAVVVIDHVKKDQEQSRYARGSGAKLAALDVQVVIEMLRPFSRRQDGVLKYTVSKDRRGWLHRYWKVRVRTDHGLIIPEFMQDELAEIEEDSVPGPPARKKIYEVLNDVPAGYRQIVDAINARYGHYLARQTVSTELNELARAGYAEGIDQGRETLWIKCR